MPDLDSQRLEAVFQSRPDIIKGVVKAAKSPASVKLFNDITSHVLEQLNGSEPAHKKRKVGTSAEPTAKGNGAATTAAAAPATAAQAEEDPVILEVKDVSFSIPVRKKLHLCFTAKHLYARSGDGGPVPGMIYAWSDFVPEKTQQQHNYVLLPRGSALACLNKTPTTGGGGGAEPLVFTVPSGAPKPGTISGTGAAAAEPFGDSYSTLFHWALSANLPRSARITATNPDKFQSVVKQPHRPKEPAVHVKAFRGSKDGFLFFLENGILWGFRKPVMFIPLGRIAAVSYCNVLRTTFNMVVEIFGTGEDGEEKTEEVEFGMIDQQDYPGIDETYVKNNKLQDRSMAEQRKARMELVENGGRKKDGDDQDMDEAGGGAPTNGRSALEQAEWEEEQRLQDEEDEEEEDYDPDNDGGSDGSGSGDDDDEDDDDDDDDE